MFASHRTIKHQGTIFNARPLRTAKNPSVPPPRREKAVEHFGFNGFWVCLGNKRKDLAATYSRGSYTSTTIGNAAFDGRVRDGIGSDHSFMATKKIGLRLSGGRFSGLGGGVIGLALGLKVFPSHYNCNRILKIKWLLEEGLAFVVSSPFRELENMLRT